MIGIDRSIDRSRNRGVAETTAVGIGVVQNKQKRRNDRRLDFGSRGSRRGWAGRWILGETQDRAPLPVSAFPCTPHVTTTRVYLSI